jgi:hypothetical protein
LELSELFESLGKFSNLDSLLLIPLLPLEVIGFQTSTQTVEDWYHFETLAVSPDGIRNEILE